MTDITVAVQNTNITVSPVATTIVQAFPAGLKGDKGSPATALNIIVTSSFSGHTVLASLSTGISIADSSDVSHIGKIVGVTSGAVSAGAEATIVTSGGVVNGFTGLNVGSPYYLSLNGLMSITPPIVGFIQQIGVAISSTELAINLGLPFKLA